MSQSTFVVSEEVANAFWEKVKKVEDENSCWPWVGGWTDKDGRGRWRLEGKSMISSRAALLISKGPPPNDNWDLQACHTCEVADGLRDHSHRPLPLHPHVRHPDVETEPARFELVGEVVPGCAADAGDDADAHR